MNHILKNTLIASILVAFVVLGVSVGFNLTGKTKNVSSPVTTELEQVSIIAQASEPEAEEVKATSLDGGKTLLMKSIIGEGGFTEYSFSVDGEAPFYTETLDSNSSFGLTYNTWEPSDKYVYISVNKNGVKDAYVFNANGEDFADGKKIMSAQDYFSKRNIIYKFDEATGWGGTGLLQIKTTKEDGTRGPNFWLEVPSGAVLQLAH